MMESMDWAKEFQKTFPGTKLNEPLSLHTTFRIGGPADAYIEVSDADMLAKLFLFSQAHKVPVSVIGWGSNLLVRDGGIRGIVLRLSGDFENIRFDGRRVFAGAAVRLPALVAACAEQGLTGTEPLVGIPGTVGGALVMNGGTREGEIGKLVKNVQILNLVSLREESLDRSAIVFKYRESNLEGKVILSTELELKEGSKVDILKYVRELQQRRLQTQPIHTYNVGSTFKNPPGQFVAQLIEQAGLKGARSGGAVVSEKHANFFENAGGATAKDVLDLVELVRGKIKERFGVDLVLEMKVVGEA